MDVEPAWSQESYLTAAVFDALNVGNWQRSGDGKAPKPSALARPGAKSAEQTARDRMASRARRFAARQSESTEEA